MGGCGECSITFLGGEPYLIPVTLERYNREIKNITKVADVSIVSHFGHQYQLISRINKTLGVSRVQVTLDGGRRVHDSFRSRRGGGGTYELIRKNVQSALEGGIEISLRINVADPRSRTSFEVLEDYALLSDSRNLSIYLAMVDDTELFRKNCGNGYTEPWLDLFSEWYEEAILAGFQASLPSHTGGCGTCRSLNGRNGLILAGDGVLYSCWDSVGDPRHVVGNVATGYASPEITDKKWVQCGYLSASDVNHSNMLLGAAHLGLLSGKDRSETSDTKRGFL